MNRIYNLFIVLFKPLQILSTFICLGAFSSILLATAENSEEEQEERWYQVEIILFEQLRDDRGGDENYNFRHNDLYKTLNRSVELIPLHQSDTTDLQNENLDNRSDVIVTPLQPKNETFVVIPSTLLPFTIPSEDHLILTELKQKLARSRYYRPLLHTAWIQPGLEKEKAIAVHIHNLIENSQYSDVNYTMEMEVTSAEIGLQAEGRVESAEEKLTYFHKEFNNLQPANRKTTTLAQVDGTLTLYLSRYLHLQTDLYYRLKDDFSDKKPSYIERPQYSVTGDSGDDFKQLSALLLDDRNFKSLSNPFSIKESISEDTARYAKMDESRKIRSRELHYIDHPFFGLIVQINPVELPEPIPSLSPANTILIPITAGTSSSSRTDVITADSKESSPEVVTPEPLPR